MTNSLCLIDTTNIINSELLDYLDSERVKVSDEEIHNMKEILYSKYLRQLELVQKHRDANRAAYNETARLRMKEHFRDNPIYKEKQRLAYIKKRYGVETEEEVIKTKAEEAMIKAKLIIDRNDKKQLDIKPSKRRMKLDFKTFVATKITENN